MTIQSTLGTSSSKHSFAISTVAKFAGLDVDNVSAEFEKRFTH